MSTGPLGHPIFFQEMGTRGVIAWSTLTLGLVAIFIVPVLSSDGLRCYQCDSTNNTHLFQCNEFLTDDIDMLPESCNNVYGAKYCIKHVGRFEVLALECYQCSSAEEWTCDDSILTMDAQKPESCDYLDNAQYCIKTIGLYGGGVGTKRFCSSANMGNQCNYVKYQGDELEYRTCVYTCSSDGCNPAVTIIPSTMTLALTSTLTLLYLLQR